MDRPLALDRVAGVTRLRDTCNVYLLATGRDGVLVDVGSGAILDRLEEAGVDRITDVLVTHHHRDGVQGLARAAAHGARIWVPPLERELIAGADELWAHRKLDNDYELRQERFSLLHSVPVAGVVDEYRARAYGGIEVYALPTPGHTPGSVTYLVELDGRRLAFSGDLVLEDGKVWSLASTQWSYSGVEGPASSVVSMGVLSGREPDVLLPAHGDEVADPAHTLATAAAGLQELVDLRRGAPWDLEDLRLRPWDEVTPHVLRNRAGFANSFALLSDAGAALLVDFGYDLLTGILPTTERAARRALLWPIEALKREHGIDRVEVVVATHYHDDHVAGFELLRSVEGAEVWAPANVAPVLEDPRRYDLPCLWWEPIPVDRTLALGEPVVWREYELTSFAFPGHTLYAAALAWEADGTRIVATGDQYTTDPGRSVLNYQYRNRFRIDDFVASAELLRELRPQLVLSGHWHTRVVDDDWLDELLEDGRRLAELHRELLPLEQVDFGAEGAGARIAPYRSSVAAGSPLVLEVAVRNPFDSEQPVRVELVVPAGWTAPAAQELTVGPHAPVTLQFEVTAGTERERRARLAVDLTVGGSRFGQLAEALVDVT